MYHNNCVFTNDEGRRVALIRHLRELTQKDVGRMIGKSGSYVSGVESGRLDVVDYEGFAKALGVSVDYIKKGGEISLEKW